MGTTETERDFFVGGSNVNFGRDECQNHELKRSLIDALGPQPVNSSYLLRDVDKEVISGLGGISGLDGDMSVVDDTEFKYDELEE